MHDIVILLVQSTKHHNSQSSDDLNILLAILDNYIILKKTWKIICMQLYLVEWVYLSTLFLCIEILDDGIIRS